MKRGESWRMRCSERMKRLNRDPAMRAKQDTGRRVEHRRKSFHVPLLKVHDYFNLIRRKGLSANEAARVLDIS
jgi:hypothetical protein